MCLCSRSLIVGVALLACALLVGCPDDPGTNPDPNAPPSQSGNTVKPSAAFSATPRVGTPPMAVQFTDLSEAGTSPIEAWNWNFGDGGTSLEQNPAHTYLNPGEYNVSLYVVTAAGSSLAQTSAFITVGDHPAMATSLFNASRSRGVAPLTVQFSDRSLPGSTPITSWLWDFDDGGTSTQQSPEHSFMSVGDYEVSLTVTSELGDSMSSQFITVFQLPNAGFTADNTTPYTVEPVQFTDTTAPGSSPIVSWDWDFGDGMSSSAQNPLHSYANTVFGEGVDSVSYTVELTVQTADGTDIVSRPAYITVFQARPANAAFNIAPGPNDRFVDDPISFVNVSTAGSIGLEANTWLWLFGDGRTSKDSNTVHAYNTTGTYIVTLTATSEHGTDRINQTVTIKAKAVPQADFTVSPEPLATEEVTFTDTTDSAGASKPIAGWLWNFGDGSTESHSTATAPEQVTHTYAAAGNYTVSLTIVTDHGNNTKEVEVTVAATVAPTASFAAVPRIILPGETVEFESTSNEGTAPITSLSWSFGDGGTAQGVSADHVYENVGAYTVTLTASSEHGENTTVRTDYITVKPFAAPIAEFSVDIQDISVEQEVTFTDESTFGTSDAASAEFLWDFGDNETSTERNPAHTYTSEFDRDPITDEIIGFPVTLTVTIPQDPPHNQDTEAKTNFVVVRIIPPTAAFTTNPAPPVLNQDTLFTDTSLNGSSEIASWAWTFADDDSTSTEQNPTHNFAALGEYDVTLTVTSSYKGQELTDTLAQSVEVVATPPVADFTFPAQSYDTGETIVFTSISMSETGLITQWAWDFGDGTTSAEASPAHMYFNYGGFLVTLTVTTEFGASHTVSQLVTVEPQNPEADFTISNPNPLRYELLQFTDLSDPGTGVILSWEWNFGDPNVDPDNPIIGMENTSTAQNPSHVYARQGIYQVTLIITTSQGVMSTVTREVVVKDFDLRVDFDVDKRIVYTGIDSVTFFDESVLLDSSAIFAGNASWRIWNGDPEDIQNINCHRPYVGSSVQFCASGNVYTADPQDGLYYHFFEAGLYHVAMNRHVQVLTNPGDPYDPYNNGGTIGKSTRKTNIIEVREPSAFDMYARNEAIDQAYDVTKTGTIVADGYTAYTLDMISQTWMLYSNQIPVVDAPWEHSMAVILPDNYDENKTALLYVAGGDTGVPVPELDRLADFAKATGSVVAVVANVPNQPLSFNNGPANLRGHDMIAYSFDRFLEGDAAGLSDRFWPALFPMAKSVLKGMDAVQGFLSGHVVGGPTPPIEISKFVLAGTSERAWAAYLAASHDERVEALIPMASDFVDIDRQLRLQLDRFGAPKEGLTPYTDRNVIMAAQNLQHTYGLGAINVKEFLRILQHHIRLLSFDLLNDGVPPLGDNVDFALVAQVHEFLEGILERTFPQIATASLTNDVVTPLGVGLLQYLDPQSDYWNPPEPEEGDMPLPPRSFYGDNPDGADPEELEVFDILRVLTTSTVNLYEDWMGEAVSGLEVLMEQSLQNTPNIWLHYLVDPARHDGAYYGYLTGWYHEFGGRLNMPKFIISPTGSHIFTPDATGLYYQDLTSTTALRYIPNTDHSFNSFFDANPDAPALDNEFDALMAAVSWFERIVEPNVYSPQPDYSWTILDDGVMAVTAGTNQAPLEAKLWTAKSASGDFTLDATNAGGPKWSATLLADHGGTGEYLIQVDPDPTKYIAYFVELTYAGLLGDPEIYTTETQVLDALDPNSTVPPAPNFKATDRVVLNGEPVSFLNLSEDGTFPIVKYTWDFGDGTTSNEVNPTHTYEELGTYTVTLTAVASNLQSNTLTREDYITVRIVEPTPNFEAAVQMVSLGEPVSFQNLSIEGTFPIALYTWDFGDDTTSNQINPTHTYAATGTYSVSLTATATDMQSDTLTREDYITVRIIESDIQTLAANVSVAQYETYHLDIESSGLGLYGGALYNQGYRNRDGWQGIGSLGNQEARLYLVDKFTAMGLNVSVQGSYLNVVGEIPGTTTPEKIYILGAHYDHVGGDMPGGDDNASGTAGLLEAARVLSQYQFESTIRFVAFNAEEDGLMGARDYVNNHVIPNGENIMGMLNLDMILRPGRDDVEGAIIDVDLEGITNFPLCIAWGEAYQQAAADYVPSLIVDETIAVYPDDYSDHAPFVRAGLPAILVIENSGDQWPDGAPNNIYYHTYEDASDRLANDPTSPSGVTYDYAFATDITRVSVALLAQEAKLDP